MNDAMMIAIGLLADDAPHDTGPDFGKASPFGLLIVVLLMIGTFLLVWSMNRHLRKLPESFDRDNHEQDRAADEGSAVVDPDLTTEDPKREPGG